MDTVLISRNKKSQVLRSICVNEWTRILYSIESKDYEYISFDIFDTLILRPLWEPADLFYFVGILANQLNLVKNEFEFYNIRKKAELELRSQIKEKQDITLDEIYNYIQKKYISNSKIELLRNNEIFVENELCYRRESGFKLFSQAVDSGKKIILISDMYLSKEVINDLINKNGYDNIHEIYVSSDIGLGKYTGDLYKYVLKDLGISNKRLLHIGDNYQSDIKKAHENGIDTCYLPKAKDVYKKNINTYIKCSRLPVRVNNAIHANIEWDNPFIKSEVKDYKAIYEELLKNYIYSINDSNEKFGDELQNNIVNKVLFFLSRKLWIYRK